MRKLLFILVILLSSFKKEKKDNDIRVILNSTNSVEKINLNGYYSFLNNKTVSNPKNEDMLVFFKNNICCYLALSGYSLVDRHENDSWFVDAPCKYFEWSVTNWGVYKVENSKISAIVFRKFYLPGVRLRNIKTYFTGDILNNDTIVNWKIAEPIQNIKKEFNNTVDFEYVPKTFYFVEDARKKLIDSNKAWVNKFRS